MEPLGLREGQIVVQTHIHLCHEITICHMLSRPLVAQIVVQLVVQLLQARLRQTRKGVE